jgi:fructose-1,6-bisphosphatase II / sedoheptulose-1,7-bisphosphatase
LPKHRQHAAAGKLSGDSNTQSGKLTMAAAENAHSVLDRILTLELVRVTERAAVAAARLRGRGDEMAADQAAVDAMRTELNKLNINGTIVIGEGERDEAPMLYIGEKVGLGTGSELDIALDPLEGTTICAKNLPNSLAVIAIAERGNLLYAPDVYMDKIAIGPGYPEGLIHLDASPAENIAAVAKAKGVPISEVTACIMDRPRHAKLIEAVRATGAAIRLIGDGDVAGVIHTTAPEDTGIDIYIGIGGAPEGVLAAAALRCTGGQMQGRLILDTPEKVARAARMGISDPNRLYDLKDMAKGDVLFAATGVTDGNMLAGVKFAKDFIETETIVLRAHSLTIREIKAKHRDLDKFL